MQLNIVCVGKLKEDWLKAAQQHYLERIRKHCKTQITEVPDFPLNGDTKKVIEKESDTALSKCTGFIICCDRRGKQTDSVNFSKMLIDALTARGTVSFVIGGSAGLSDTVIQKAALCISFSDLTMPHRLFRIVLLEQIYRAFKIDKGETYHK